MSPSFLVRISILWPPHSPPFSSSAFVSCCTSLPGVSAAVLHSRLSLPPCLTFLTPAHFSRNSPSLLPFLSASPPPWVSTLFSSSLLDPGALPRAFGCSLPSRVLSFVFGGVWGFRLWPSRVLLCFSPGSLPHCPPAEDGKEREMSAGRAASERSRTNLGAISRRLVGLLADRDEPHWGVRRERSPSLFVDIVGFTRMAENMTPEPWSTLLRSPRVRNGGAIFASAARSRLPRDSIFAVFACPPRALTTPHALCCAGRMLDALKGWNRRAPARVSRRSRSAIGPKLLAGGTGRCGIDQGPFLHGDGSGYTVNKHLQSLHTLTLQPAYGPLFLLSSLITAFTSFSLHLLPISPFFCRDQSGASRHYCGAASARPHLAHPRLKIASLHFTVAFVLVRCLRLSF